MSNRIQQSFWHRSAVGFKQSQLPEGQRPPLPSCAPAHDVQDFMLPRLYNSNSHNTISSSNLNQLHVLAESASPHSPQWALPAGRVASAGIVSPSSLLATPALAATAGMLALPGKSVTAGAATATAKLSTAVAPQVVLPHNGNSAAADSLTSPTYHTASRAEAHFGTAVQALASAAATEAVRELEQRLTAAEARAMAAERAAMTATIAAEAASQRWSSIAPEMARNAACAGDAKLQFATATNLNKQVRPMGCHRCLIADDGGAVRKRKLQLLLKCKKVLDLVGVTEVY